MKTLIRKLSIGTSVCAVIFLSSFTQVVAEDIEIYNRVQTEPNVLFILDQSESMLELVGSTGLTRDQMVKQAFQQVMGQTYNNLNIGFMDYGRDNGAGVDLPVADINQPAKNVEPNVVSTTETYASMLSRFVSNVEGPQNNARTATVEALLEAAKYYRGDIIDNKSQGYQGPPGVWNDSDSDYWDSATGSGSSHWRAAGPRTYTGGTWNSSSTQGPFGATCQQTAVAGITLPVCSNPWPGSCNSVSAVSPSNTPSYTHTHGSTCQGGFGCKLWNVDNTECVDYGCLGSYTANGPHTHPATTNPGSPAYVSCRETGTLTSSGFNGDRYYTSPIQTACTENFIVLLSDGGPTILGSHEQTSIKNIAGISACEDLSAAGFSDLSIQQKGKCGPDLVKALANNDQASSISGTQTVNTYTVGFDLGAGASEAKDYLQLLADDGEGQFFDANGANGVSNLVNIFQNIFNAITQKSRTISRVGNTLDLTTLGSSRDEIYVPMFTAELNQPRWPGNLKGYNVDPTGILVDISNPAIPVFDSAGDFRPSTRSFWSTTPDGGSASLGGVASLLNPGTRTVHTDDGPGVSRSLQYLDSANTALTSAPALFGLPGSTTTAEMQDLISWARGVDIDDEDSDGSTSDPRNFVGDALHSDPIVANYTGGSIERVAYFMTNEGYLHAIDVTGNTSTSGGNELFSYMPSDLLDNLTPLRQNVGGNPKVYGLDGPLTLFQVGGPTNSAGSKYLFFGMRRGGMNYYAMDVTDPTAPSLMWVIEGGSGDFQEMGQSWAEPIVTNVDIDGTPTLALVIGGGYDINQDTVTTYTPDTRGRAVYIVDAVTGTKLWSAGPSSSPDSHDLNLALTNGIASDVSVIDFNNDTIADRLYFADTGGHVWRIDLQGNLNGTAGFADDYSGYKLAILHGTATNNNRRFFARPVVAFTPNGKLAVAIGSGHRSHPLDLAVQDRFYVMYDPDANAVPSSAPSPLTDTNLQDLTGFSNGFNDTNKVGWRIDLDIAGEKVFNAASILRGEVFISTYFPPAQQCSNTPDGSRLFVLDLEGKPTRDLDSTTTGMDAFVSTQNFGIVSEFTLHYSSHDGNVRGINLPNVESIYSTGSLFDRFWTNNP
ncbi:MAG: pilus assembly protein [Gammaproteobacteria bacterium]